MAAPADIGDLLMRWQNLRCQGRPMSAEELCAGCLDLLPDLKEAIEKLERMEAVLALDELLQPIDPEKANVGAILGDYELLEKLGEGAMGIVYKARNIETDSLVALKAMKQLDPNARHRFQQEFLKMSNFSHPNCVKLFDFFTVGEQLAFTMELIEGRSMLIYLGAAAGTDPSTATESSDSWNESDGSPDSPDPAPAPPPPARNVDRLLAIFRDLAKAILFLHHNEILHRDIKPSNVMVDHSGCVKLLDFGMVTDAHHDEKSVSQGMVGTFLWMAPEQSDGLAAQASDWYSFGAVLYEALTGSHPFRGTAYEMPWKRKSHYPPPVQTRAPDIPADLARLSDDLLRPSPDDRPSGPDILHRLGLLAPPPPPPPPPFVGREDYLAQMQRAFEDSQHDQPVTMLLHGSSGVGKTALVQHFLNHVRQQHSHAVVLRGRCYERVSVPYKALDGLVDNLSRFWRRLYRQSSTQAVELLPDDVGPLVRVFPVLLRVEAVAERPGRKADYPDPQELRRKAFAALRQVLWRIADRWPLVIHLDDLQWGDLDSALVLTTLLLPPDAPRLLLLASFRSDNRDISPFLSAFLQTSAGGTGFERRELALEVLSHEDAVALASRLLAEQDGAHTVGELDSAAHKIARESGGSPFFIFRLIQAYLAGDVELALGKVIWRGICNLTDDQRRLLDVVAVASRPLPGAIALRAADLGNEGTLNLIELQKAKWLRPAAGDHRVETYHDRIRETVLPHLSPQELIEHHRRLAAALQASGKADPEMLANHFEGAGEKERAADNYIRAAETTADALAFDQAARLYRLVLVLRPANGEEHSTLQTRLGDALANAGRGAEAARAYLDAVSGAPPTETLKLQRQAADQFLRAGHLREGLDVLRLVLQRVGESFPETPRRALLSVLWGRARLWWHGTNFRERDASQIPPQDLVRMDVCWTAASVLSLVDTIRGHAFHTRHALLALHAGELNRVSRALATEAVYHACVGHTRQVKVETLFGKLQELVERTGHPELRAFVDSMAGCAALLLGNWKKASALSERAEERFRKDCKGVAWELGAACHVRLSAMRLMGQFKDFAAEVPDALREARQRGDLFTATNLRIHSALLHVAADEPDKAQQTLTEAMHDWPNQGFHLQHFNAWAVQIWTTLYTGEAQLAWRTVTERWQEYRQSMLMRIQLLRLDMLRLRACCALAVVAAAPRNASGRTTAKEFLHAAEQDARKIEWEQAGWAMPWVSQIRAGIAALRGNSLEAIARLEIAEDGFCKADMHLFAHVGQRCRGVLLGGIQGQELIQAADAAMKDQLIRKPAKIASTLLPGIVEIA